ncbi:hypothetical protein HK097_009874 [Rhizophlyctis rosea]|uniref:Uncharacterized protein n=1 Tax=Rhizophlyctis rosea TaxID=64517 RepID=A0AAD5S8A9_9FUNG|nr:hypothetical protein HK097_009874 [Rhizophlyctis rosea]
MSNVRTLLRPAQRLSRIPSTSPVFPMTPFRPATSVNPLIYQQHRKVASSNQFNVYHTDYNDYDQLPYSFREKLMDLSPTAWLRVLTVATIGGFAGFYGASHFASLLQQLGLYEYVPEDDDDDDDETVAAAQYNAALPEDAYTREKITERGFNITKKYTDFKTHVSFDWGGTDASYITLSKAKLAEQLQELEEEIKLKNPQGLPAKQAELTRSFIRQNLAILDERLQLAREKEYRERKEAVIKIHLNDRHRIHSDFRSNDMLSAN